MVDCYQKMINWQSLIKQYALLLPLGKNCQRVKGICDGQRIPSGCTHEDLRIDKRGLKRMVTADEAESNHMVFNEEWGMKGQHYPGAK